ncbi:MAG: [Fe-Fe] hydrogenase large subunit C-terminal domain-containing protein [Armatimonadota bacterium]
MMQNKVYKPVYSEGARCQDCYKCVRECPVKAIRVTNNQASIVPELCIVCGHCVSVCPSGAKKVRDDLPDVKQVISNGSRVFVSLAPSFVSEFNGVGPAKLIHTLKMLGFSGVSETALGAQQVSAQAASDIERNADKNNLYISSACPVVVEYISKYLPERAASITHILSPLLAHCKLIKDNFGEDTSVVFIGPCIAKKLDAHYHPELLSAAITFEDLRAWLADEKISLDDIQPDDSDIFIPKKAAEGAIYPVEGGMLEATRLNCVGTKAQFQSISGIENIDKALRSIDPANISHSVFLELLACEGGCVNGPKAQERSEIESRLNILDYTDFSPDAYPRRPAIGLADDLHTPPISRTDYTQQEIESTLHKIGKQSIEDELNCGGCGYHSCRELAWAILAGNAEPNMCVSYMRELAQKKANAILHTLPYATVIVDEKLSIIECNSEFVKLGGSDLELVSEAVPGLVGAALSSILPFSELFADVLESGEDIIRKYIRFGDTVLSVTIFTVERHRVVGAIMINVTSTELRREQIVEKAQQVIQNMLTNVQDIAFRLGKSSAESELILNSIVDGFSVARYDKDEEMEK